MPRFEELGGYYWVDENSDEQQVQPAVIRPLFEYIAQ
jgi:hypothetical protein